MLYVSTKSSYYYSFRKEKELRNSGETRHGKKKLRVYHAILYSFEAMNMIILKTFLGKQSNNRSISCSV